MTIKNNANSNKNMPKKKREYFQKLKINFMKLIIKIIKIYS